MIRQYFLAVLATFSRALAQEQGETGANNATAPTTPDGEVTIHTITVGKIENEFQPNSIVAKPGDIVKFVFYPANHSVIRAEFGYPCIPYEDITNGPGFFSQFQPVADNETWPTWNLTVNTTDPVFYYCGAPGSCIGWGMLGVINPSAETPLDTQLRLARQANYMVEPGQALPEDAKTSLQALAATATTTLTATVTATSSPSPTSAAATPSATPHHSSSLSGGAIAGIAVGAVAVAIIAALLFFLLGRTKTLKEMLAHRDGGRPEMQASGGAPAPWMGGHDGQAYSRHQSAQLPPYQPVPQFYQQENKPPAHATTRQMSPELVQNERFQSGSFAPASGYRFSGTSELGSENHPPPRSLQSSPAAYELSSGRSPTSPENVRYQ